MAFSQRARLYPKPYPALPNPAGLFFDHPKPEAQIQGFVVGTQDLGYCHAKYLAARHCS